MPLDEEDLRAKASANFSVDLSVFTTMSQLLRDAVRWSRNPIAESLRLFPSTGLARLKEIEAS